MEVCVGVINARFFSTLRSVLNDGGWEILIFTQRKQGLQFTTVKPSIHESVGFQFTIAKAINSLVYSSIKMARRAKSNDSTSLSVF